MRNDQAEAVKQYENLFSSERKELGKKFGKLLEEVPFPASDLYNYIVDVAEVVSQSKQGSLLTREDVKSAPDKIQKLIKFGITPTNLLRVFLSIEDIIDEYGEKYDFWLLMEKI